ncbi:MAG: ComF family protein [Gallionella sp.]
MPTPNGDVCGHCLSRPPMFTSTTAAFGYAFPLDKMIHSMKYGQQFALANAFASKLANTIKLEEIPDFVIPMPLHSNKLRERGFNQSLLLASNIAKSLKLKLLANSCQRVRDTPPQSALPWKERKKNVRDAFYCSIDLTGMNIALVDDVLTTGASMNALAKTLVKCGANRIDVWVVARTLPH